MRITNLDEFKLTPTIAPRQAIKVGVTSSQISDPNNSKYVSSVVEALQRNSGIERVIYPYNAAQHKDLTDAVVDLEVHPYYDGKGSNFFVNFPGFLIFAPAIWGYGYTADLNTEAVVTFKSGNSQKLSIPAKYEFRQAEIDRTWTEIGWLEVGIIPLIGGIVFTSYDEDITGEFIRNVSPSYGSYIAGKTASVIFDGIELKKGSSHESVVPMEIKN
jgi:hypothetical protein